jgi:hypothetical protein
MFEWIRQRRLKSLWVEGPLGRYALNVPKAATWTYDDASRTLTVVLPTRPVTEVLIAGWMFMPGEAEDRRSAIEQSLCEFVSGSISRVLGREITRWQMTDQSCDGRTIVQGVVPIDLTAARRGDHRWWLIRFEVAPGGQGYYFMHWNGPYRDLIRTVLPAFVSFETQTLA